MLSVKFDLLFALIQEKSFLSFGINLFFSWLCLCFILFKFLYRAGLFTVYLSSDRIVYCVPKQWQDCSVCPLVLICSFKQGQDNLLLCALWLVLFMCCWFPCCYLSWQVLFKLLYFKCLIDCHLFTVLSHLVSYEVCLTVIWQIYVFDSVVCWESFDLLVLLLLWLSR